MGTFGAYPVSWASATHGPWGSVNTEWTCNVTVFSSEPPKGQSLALGTDVAVGGGIIDELIFEVGALHARMIAFGHHQQVAPLFTGCQIGGGMLAAIGQSNRYPFPNHILGLFHHRN